MHTVFPLVIDQHQSLEQNDDIELAGPSHVVYRSRPETPVHVPVDSKEKKIAVE